MAYPNGDASFYQSTTATGNFDTYPFWMSTNETTNSQALDTLADPYRDAVEQLGSAVNPPTSVWMPSNDGKHRDHGLTDWGLTKGLQIRWPWPPHVYPGQANTPNRHTNTQGNTGRKIEFVFQLSHHRVGTILSPPRWGWKPPHPSRPLYAVRTPHLSVTEYSPISNSSA